VIDALEARLHVVRHQLTDAARHLAGAKALAARRCQRRWRIHTDHSLLCVLTCVAAHRPGKLDWLARSSWWFATWPPAGGEA
jgi:hypothetical protein